VVTHSAVFSLFVPGKKAGRHGQALLAPNARPIKNPFTVFGRVSEGSTFDPSVPNIPPFKGCADLN
jgi:hypothetical protein